MSGGEFLKTATGMFTFDLGNIFGDLVGHPQEAAATANAQAAATQAQADAAVEVAGIQAQVTANWQTALLILGAIALVAFIIWIILK